jgi:hypothetical protein
MKVAFFVEGYTEQILIRNLIIYNYGLEKMSYARFRLRGGGKAPYKVYNDEQHNATCGSPIHVFNIFDCMGFTALQSMISYQATSLYNNGFEKIIGIRDVYPNPKSDISKLKRSMPYGVPQKPIQKHFILAVMETEAWFISNEEHYLKISSILTKDHIQEQTGIDISLINVEDLEHPAETLNQIYSLAGESYEKTVISIDRTVNNLDLFHLLTDTRIKSSSLNELLNHM